MKGRRGGERGNDRKGSKERGRGNWKKGGILRRGRERLGKVWREGGVEGRGGRNGENSGEEGRRVGKHVYTVLPKNCVTFVFIVNFDNGRFFKCIKT